MSKDNRIPVMEIFGPTIQGEGTLTGAISHFVRTGGCGYKCSWCDSMFAVTPSEVKKNAMRLTTQEILNKIKSLPYAPWVTLSGGDPCLHDQLEELIHPLHGMDMRVAIETQGQLWPTWLKELDLITLSPKGPSSGNTTDQDAFVNNLTTLFRTTNASICIKVVVFDLEDFEYAVTLWENLERVQPWYDQFWFQAGTQHTMLHHKDFSDALALRKRILDSYQQLCDTLLLRGIRLSSTTRVGAQQHALLWPEQVRGK